MSLVTEKFNYFIKNTYVLLIIIGLSAFSIRLYFFPYDVPITEDGLFYFRYAIDTSILGNFPNTHLVNNGWPLLMSIFFSMFHSDNFLDYMTLQRLVSVSISVFTIIPVYLLIRRFFEPKFAIIGSLLFVLDPRIIQNSLLGITEPLYIILVTSSIYFFLSNRINMIYVSFGIAALCAQIRYEGIMLLFMLSIMFFVRQRKEKKIIIKYAICITVFVLVLLPMGYVRTITVGSDGITDGITSGMMVYGIEASENDGLIGMLSYIFTGIQSLMEYLGWIMIPYFLFFVPLGTLMVLKKRNSKNLTIILTIIVLLVPALYAYSREIQDTRYLYVLYPIFCVVSIFAIKFLHEKIKKIFLIIIIGVIISSIIFLNIKIDNYEHEREAYEIAKYIQRSTDGMNSYYPESKYVRVVGMIDEFPILSSSVSFGPKVFDPNSQLIQESIENNRNEGLEHLVVDGKNDREEFLHEIFINDKEYDYLTKVFDSKEFGYKYHVKMYKINYEKYDLTQ